MLANRPDVGPHGKHASRVQRHARLTPQFLSVGGYEGARGSVAE